MDTLLFLLRFHLLFAVLMLVHQFVLRTTVHHYFNRLYLLLAPALALLVIFIADSGVSAAVYAVQLPTFGMGEGATIVNDGASLDVLFILGLIWVVGIILQATVFLAQLWRLHRMMSGETPITVTCTFLRHIRIAPDLGEEVRDKVLIHEQVHADQLHSVDLIWYALWRVVFWYDPSFVLGRMALKNIHEYIADRLTDSRTDRYADTLLASAFGLSRLPMANEFNSLNIKNRIDMLNKKNSNAQRSRLLIGLSILVLTSALFACTSITADPPSDEMFSKVDVMPRFPGCEEVELTVKERGDCANGRLFSYLGAEIKYPKASQDIGEEGIVAVQFVIDREGKVVSPAVVRSQSALLDAEALRVISSMPDWTPGRQAGERVNVQLVVPIKFALE